MTPQALVQCRDCGHSVSTRAKVCPNCGRPRPQPTDWRSLIAASCLVIGLTYLCVRPEHDISEPAEVSYTPQEFSARLEAGAGCAELFEVRNALRDSATLEEFEKVNRELRAVGCRSGDDVRYTGPFRDASFTVREFRVYANVMKTPMGTSEKQALARAAEAEHFPPRLGRRIVEKVTAELSRLGRMGFAPEAQIRHAKDWKDELD